MVDPHNHITAAAKHCNMSILNDVGEVQTQLASTYKENISEISSIESNS
jgi:hypothetical protein